LPFKFNLQRYITGQGRCNYQLSEALDEVGLYRFNPVDP
jgi:hypothetical protein